MNHTSENRSAHDHVRTALEESCAVLITLELIRTGIGDAGYGTGVRVLVERAIESVREVIAELRMT